METELYQTMVELLLSTGLSERKFCERYEIPHAWFIEFMNPNKPFREMQWKTMSMLKNKFNIEQQVCIDYNTWVVENKEK